MMRRTLVFALALAALLSAAQASVAAVSEDKAEKKNEATAAIESMVDTKSADKKAEPAKKTAPAEKAEPAKTAQTKTEPAKIEPAKTEPAAQPSEPIPGRPIKPSPMGSGEPETEQSLLVTPEWLRAHSKEVVIVDSRPESLYAGGHIPGAVNASWTYFANMNAPTGSMKYGTVYNSTTMARRIGALGINGKKMVVAYCDAGGWGQSGWTLWILRMSGIKNAKILDGGLTGWKQAGGSISRTKHSNKAVAFSIKGYKGNYLVNTEWINNNLGKPGLAIIDVRTVAEYKGAIRPFQEKRAGHLPTAINIELERFVTPTHNFREEQEIIDTLAQHGITPETEIVVYDTAGVRAAFVTMALRYAGFNKSMCYDEGFQAWAGKADLPLEK